MYIYDQSDLQITGRSHRSYRTYGEEVPLRDSENADDTAVVFNHRQNAMAEMQSLVNRFRGIGAEIHTGVLELIYATSVRKIIFGVDQYVCNQNVIANVWCKCLGVGYQEKR